MILSNEEKTTYLANLVFIARADNKISSLEESAIELIQKSIGARKTELNRAYRMAEDPNFTLTPIGSWADKIKNLESIIYISMVDDSVHDEEELIIDFSNQLNISQEQLECVISDVESIISTLNNDTYCPSCNAKIKSTSKFCPQCGIQLSGSEAATPISYDIPEKGIAIEFAESTASGFHHALQNQKEAPVNATCVKGKKNWYLASWPKEEILTALELVENLKGLRNRKVYVDGKESKWDTVFGFSWCASSRAEAYRPEEYCFGLDDKRLNIWGCKQIRMDWSDWAEWFTYGTFQKSGILKNKMSFVFDKKRIRHELESNLYKLRLCPHIQFELIEAVIKNLPDEVTPTANGLWRYKRDYDQSPGSILVKLKVKNDGYNYTDEFQTSGVVPHSVEAGLEILKKAIAESKNTNKGVQKVLEYKD